MKSNVSIKQLGIVFFGLVFCLLGCKRKSIDCEGAKISIENRWSDINGGLSRIEVMDKEDINFICEEINSFPQGNEVMISYSYGDIDLDIII